MRGSKIIGNDEIRYATLIASGEQSMSGAYRQVWPERCKGISSGAVASKAHNLAKRPEIVAEIERIKDEARSNAAFTRDNIIDRYKALLDQGDRIPVTSATQYAAVAAAKARILESLIKLYGYAEPERVEAGITIRFDGCEDCAD